MAFISRTHDLHHVCTNLTLGVCPYKKGQPCPLVSSTERSYCSEAFVDGKKRDGRKRARMDKPLERQWGYSIELMLYDDPWMIKKILTKSDLGNLSRLLLDKDQAETLVLPVLSFEAQRDAMTDKGTKIMIWDVDTNSMHYLVFKLWGSSQSYVFVKKWTEDFVRRRDLKKGDEIGLHWDPCKNCFDFTVLQYA